MFQQEKKPDFVLHEELRVGKQSIVGFPNFVHFRARFQIFFHGKVPVTSSLPFEWYDTPNLHFLGIAGFSEYCKRDKLDLNKPSTWREKEERDSCQICLQTLGSFFCQDSDQFGRWMFREMKWSFLIRCCFYYLPRHLSPPKFQAGVAQPGQRRRIEVPIS